MKRIATTLLVAGLAVTPLLVLPPPAAAGISIGISVNLAPPPLPVYEQPVIPGPGYIWTPGYWAWDPAYGYYWVPGTWIVPPRVGLLWTPGWWGWSGDAYRWHAGYWGAHVGFYGGVNYGFGYFGTGYVGGFWRNNQFYYNRAVNNVTNVTNIRNVYVNRTVINHVNVNRVSYNGGRGGLAARPTAAQATYARQSRIEPTAVQTRQREVALRDPAQRFKTNQGRPAVFATQRAGDLSGPHAVRAPAAAPNRMAPHATHANATAATAGRKMVEAPRNRVQASTESARQHGMAEAPRNRPQSQANRNARVVQAPHQQVRENAAAPRPEVERARPSTVRPEQAPRPRAEPRANRAPQRNERRATPERGAPAKPEHKAKEKHPPQSSGGSR